MVNPKISIIVPIYNVEKYLDRCLESLINQTLKDIEIILVDDGSPDSCPTLCDNYGHRDSRIKVIHKKNEGLGLARNSGIEIATGEYIAFVDSDDYIGLDMYNCLYSEAVNSNADAVFCGFKNEIQKGVWIESKEVSQRSEWNGNEITNFMFDMIACAPYIKKERKYEMSVWRAIYRNQLIQQNNIRFQSERLIVSEDIPMNIDFLIIANKIVYVPHEFYYYCLNSTSLTATLKTEKFFKFKNLYHILEEKLQDKNNYKERLDRLFIGHSRMHFIKLMNSTLPDQRIWLRKYMKDNIWHELKNRYKPSYLPLYSGLFYNFIINDNPIILELYIYFTSRIKQTINQFKSRNYN